MNLTNKKVLVYKFINGKVNILFNDKTMFDEFLEFIAVNTDLTWNSGKELLSNNSKWNTYEYDTVLSLSPYKNNCIVYTHKDKVKSTLTKPLIDYKTGMEVNK